MENKTMNWLQESRSLELLMSLTPEAFEYDDLGRCDINLDQLTPGEKAGKLLDHLDQLSGKAQDPENNDWFTEEKLANFLMFDSIPSQSNYNFIVSIKDSDLDGKYELTTLLHPNESKLMSVLSTDLTDVESKIPKIPDVEFLKPEILSPPETPKTGDLLYELKNVKVESDTVTEDQHDKNLCIEPENTLSERETDFDASSSYVPSEVDSEDSEYEPSAKVVKNQRKTLRTTATVNEAALRKVSKKVDERKLRKKKQNKDAATRYRLKKRMEVAKWRNAEKLNIEKNEQLKKKIDNLNHEITYLKSLMKDVFRAKGLIN